MMEERLPCRRDRSIKPCRNKAPTTEVFRGFSTEAADTEARHLANLT